MRKRIISFVASVALVLAFTPQAYALPEYSTYHAVYYSCICGPEPACYGTLVGEWTQSCNGHWSGWGWRPYENSCAYNVQTEVLEDCNPWD